MLSMPDVVRNFSMYRYWLKYLKSISCLYCGHFAWLKGILITWATVHVQSIFFHDFRNPWTVFTVEMWNLFQLDVFHDWSIAKVFLFYCNFFSSQFPWFYKPPCLFSQSKCKPSSTPGTSCFRKWPYRQCCGASLILTGSGSCGQLREKIFYKKIKQDNYTF